MAKKRIRGSRGHNANYTRLKRTLKEHKSKLEELENQDKPKKRDIDRVKGLIESTQNLMVECKNKYNQEYKDTFDHVSRQSVQVDPNNPAEEEYARKLFEEIKMYEEEGVAVPEELLQKQRDIKEAPSYETHMGILAHSYLALCNNRNEPMENIPWEFFLSQAHINPNWIEFQGINAESIKEHSKLLQLEKNTELLINKEYIFVGSFISYTADPSFADVLLKIVKDRKLDGIIVAGPWTKDIYLHQTFGNPIIDQVKKLVKNTQVISIRALQEKVEYIPDLVKLGVKFITFLENENNVFFGDRYTTASSKNQLNIFKDLDETKNVFAYTTYVGFETILKKNNIKFLVGSGSSSINTGRSRVYSQANSRQILNSRKYDSTGGHLLRFDEKGDVSVNSFHFSKSMDGAPLAGKFYPVKGRAKKTKLAVFASDMHISHMDMYCFTAFLDFLDRRKDDIAILYLNGDFFDNAVLSHWNEHRIDEQIKISNDKTLGCFLHEVHRARKAIDMIVSRLNPDTKLFFKWGNHEINSIKKMKSKSLLHFLGSMLDLNDLLDLKKYNFTTIDTKEAYWFGDLPIIHGNELSINQARQNLGRKVVLGHSHQCKIGNYGTVLPSMHVNKHVGYANYSHVNWAPGWGISHIVDDTFSKVEIMLMHDNNSYYDFDQKVTIGEPVKIEVDKREIPLLLKY